MTNFDFNPHHGWRKPWNSMPLDMRRITDLNIIHFHHGWRKIRNSMSLDAPWMTNFDKIYPQHSWTKNLIFDVPECA